MGNFSYFFGILIFFSKSIFLKNSFKIIIKASNNLDPDQTKHFVGPDLGPNCLQRILADHTHRKRDKPKINIRPLDK